MYDDTVFKINEVKSETLTIRLTKRQKDCIQELAEQHNMSASRLLTTLAGLYYKQVNTKKSTEDVKQ